MEFFSNDAHDQDPEGKPYLLPDAAQPAADQSMFLSGERELSDLYLPAEWVDPLVAGIPDQQPAPTPEAKELIEQQRLYDESKQATALMTRTIADIQPTSDDSLDPPAPLDMTMPLSVKQFEGTHIVAEAESAYAKLAERINRTYVKHTQLVERVTFKEGEDIDSSWGYGVYLEHVDTRGVASILVMNESRINVTFYKEGEYFDVRYRPVTLASGVQIMTRYVDATHWSPTEMLGNVPQTHAVMASTKAEHAASEFAEAMATLTGERARTAVAPDEAAFLDSLIATAEPEGYCHDGNLQGIIFKRLQSEAASAPLNTAWAARELERITHEYSQCKGNEPAEWKGGDHDVTVEVFPAGDTPASIKICSVRSVPAEKVSDWLERPMLSADDHTVITEDELAAIGNKVVLSHKTTVEDSTKDLVERFEFTYDTADITEVNRFLRIIYRPR